MLITADVLIPERIERDAIGSSTLKSLTRDGSPNASADSRIGVGMSWSPE